MFMCKNCLRSIPVLKRLIPRSYITSIYRYASIFSPFTSDHPWTKAFSDAEKIVGYPTSFMSLRYLLNDELSNVASQFRKLIGTKHPLLKTAKHFVYSNSHTLHTRGLIILLISKSAGPASSVHDGLLDTMVSGVYQSQRFLAEIAEMIHTAFLVHRGVVDVSGWLEDDGPLEDLHFGNKMAVLVGDFLLANASTTLAKIQNTHVVEIVALALRDLMSSELSANEVTDGGDTFIDWEKQTWLRAGSLLARCCEAALLLAGHEILLQQRAYSFGKNMAFTYQLREELDALERDDVSPTSAVTSIHLVAHPDDVTFRSLLASTDHAKVTGTLRASGAVAEAEALCRHYGNAALAELAHFGPGDATRALANIVRALTR